MKVMSGFDEKFLRWAVWPGILRLKKIKAHSNIEIAATKYGHSLFFEAKTYIPKTNTLIFFLELMQCPGVKAYVGADYTHAKRA